MNKKEGHYNALCELDSGRKINAHLGIFGITAFDDLRIYDGYDGVIYTDPEQFIYYDDDSWTIAEKRELAEHMIKRWRQWADA